MPSHRRASRPSLLAALLLLLATPAVAASASPSGSPSAAAPLATDAADEELAREDGQAPVLQHDADILPEDTRRDGFYVRGDVGAALFATPTARLPAPVGRFRSPSIDPAVTFGAGLGYDFGGWLRTDVTLDAVGSAGFSARSVCVGCAGGGFSRERADVSALAGLLNAYLEFDGPVRPYVGGGIGVSRVEATNWRTTRPNGRTSKRPDADGWNFAFALAGGVGFDVAENVTLDAGYRYLSLGSAETGRTALGGGAGQGRAKLEDIAVHQVRLGVRVRFP